MYPKLVALDTDGTIFTGQLDQNVWGKGRNASSKLADNIKRVNDFTLQDKANPANQVHLNKDIPQIVTDILEHGASLAIVSRNTSKALCDRALHYFKAMDPKTGKNRPIIELVRYDEVVDEPRTAHFKRIHGWSKYDYADMVLFDDDPADNVQQELGIVHICSAQTGLTWETYSAGIELWQRRPPQPGGTSKSTVLNIAHFNDVYQVSQQKIHVNNKEESIDVTKFATLLTDVTAKWEDKGDGRGKNGLIVFSGDLFSPSIESSVTRGKHMPAIVNGLGIDIGVAGNHEFDFGYPRLKELINETKFPWLLSNIVDTNTNNVPEPMKEHHVLERAGVRIGLIGLVEKEWIATITGWPENFQYKDMAEVGRDLSIKLRDPAGEFKCDVVIALTHSRIPNVSFNSARYLATKS
ncbi:hypothetical protein NM688_g3854 [Phlebia brevispora]|uniref:Uncharacterized protein n=1 Tax=Phlebia brevispora TaxID=194682 RepID=A0ACC1T4Q3_9APHY|nr:hypothetical protein NM688_g3854 [Phlebia brevispora]